MDAQGIPLDDRGQAQAAALAARLSRLPLDAIVSSPLESRQQTAAAIAATRDGQQVVTDDRVGECHYGDWTGKPLKKLAQGATLARGAGPPERGDIPRPKAL